MKTNFIVLLSVLVFFSACGGGSGGGGEASDTSDRSTTNPPPVAAFSCEAGSASESGDKELSCNDNTNISYMESGNSLCRVDNINGVSVSTCMENGSTLSSPVCTRRGSGVNCPEIGFSCDVSELSTSDNWILSCDDDVFVSMDISNSELCRVDSTNGAGFCLDEVNALNNLPIVWRGYARNFVGIGERVALNIPMWVPAGVNTNYSATPPSVCSVDEMGLLSINGFGDCDVTLTVSSGGTTKMIDKRVYGRLKQDTVWGGYTASSMDFGTAPPSPVAAEYAPNGATYRYSSEDTDICTVNATTGAIAAPTNSGNCVIVLTTSANNYADREIPFTVRVNALTLPPLTWTNPYGSGPFTVLTTVNAPTSGALTGQGALGVTLGSYRSTTPTICSVDEDTGVPTILLNGTCTIEATASLAGYNPQVRSTNLTVDLATMNLGWTSPIPSLGETDILQPNEPTGLPNSPAALGVTYSTLTEDICTVDSTTGEITAGTVPEGESWYLYSESCGHISGL